MSTSKIITAPKLITETACWNLFVLLSYDERETYKCDRGSIQGDKPAICDFKLIKRAVWRCEKWVL